MVMRRLRMGGAAYRSCHRRRHRHGARRAFRPSAREAYLRHLHPLLAEAERSNGGHRPVLFERRSEITIRAVRQHRKVVVVKLQQPDPRTHAGRRNAPRCGECFRGTWLTTGGCRPRHLIGKQQAECRWRSKVASLWDRTDHQELNYGHP